MEPDLITGIVGAIIGTSVLIFLFFVAHKSICKNNPDSNIPCIRHYPDQQKLKQKPLPILEKTPDGMRAFLKSMDIDAAVEKTINQMKDSGLFDAAKKYADDPESQEILIHINSTLDSFLSRGNFIDLGSPIVRKVFAHWFKNSPQDLINSAKNMGIEVSVYNSIYTITADYLASGEYHIYRGTLGLEGRDIHALCFRALDKIVEHGAWSSEIANEQRTIVQQQIAYVG
jgi:hypothetical protein